MSFNIGLSGLYAANKQLDVTGNNIANVATTGFKSSRAEFEDIYAASKLGTGQNSVGNGVNLATCPSSSPRATSTTVAACWTWRSRVASFRRAATVRWNTPVRCLPCGQRRLHHQQHRHFAPARLRCGYQRQDHQGWLDRPANQLIEPAAKASSTVDSTSNLNSSEVVIDQVAKPFNPSDTSTFTTQYSTTLYDTQGNAHPMVQYLVKTGSNLEPYT
jgi:flagellar hook protein FlgE